MVIREGAGAGSEHPVDGELILGREHGSADLVIDDPGVSRRHARVLTDAGGVLVEDLGSSNGTFVNGERITGPVEMGSGDELQVGATVLGIEGGTAATALLAPGAPPTERHPGPPARPARGAPPQRAPSGRAFPRRLAPPPSDHGNLPALAALFLGPLSILLVFLSTGGFFVALPCGIAAIVFGSLGIRNADRKANGHRGLARIGRFTGIVGTFLSLLAVIVFIVVAAALHSTESSVTGLVDRIKAEINRVDVPKVRSPRRAIAGRQPARRYGRYGWRLGRHRNPRSVGRLEQPWNGIALSRLLIPASYLAGPPTSREFWAPFAHST